MGSSPVSSSLSGCSENGAGRQSHGARHLAASELLALRRARAKDLDASTLRGDLEALVGHVGDLAHLAADIREAPERMLARVVDLELLAAERRPRAGGGVAAADQVVALVHVMRPVDARLGLATPALVTGLGFVLHGLGVRACGD